MGKGKILNQYEVLLPKNANMELYNGVDLIRGTFDEGYLFYKPYEQWLAK